MQRTKSGAKRLTLTKDTIRELSPTETSEVNGGYTTISWIKHGCASTSLIKCSCTPSVEVACW